jgi:hypothetical protein
LNIGFSEQDSWGLFALGVFCFGLPVCLFLCLSCIAYGRDANIEWLKNAMREKTIRRSVLLANGLACAAIGLVVLWGGVFPGGSLDERPSDDPGLQRPLFPGCPGSNHRHSFHASAEGLPNSDGLAQERWRYTGGTRSADPGRRSEDIETRERNSGLNWASPDRGNAAAARSLKHRNAR